MTGRYVTNVLLSYFAIPFLYVQGKRIRASVPSLPEAKGKEGTEIFDKESKDTIQLLTIGESTIAGIGVETHQEGFTGTLAKELSQLLQINIEWKVYAKSGYTAKKVNLKLIPIINTDNPDLIVIGLGGNDAFTLNSLKKWKQEINKLIQTLKLKFPDALIVFINMPPIKEFPAFTKLIKWTIGNRVEILGEALQKIVNTYERVLYSDEIISLKNWEDRISPDLSNDGVHPSKITYQTWAKDVAQKIILSGYFKKII